MSLRPPADRAAAHEGAVATWCQPVVAAAAMDMHLRGSANFIHTGNARGCGTFCLLFPHACVIDIDCYTMLGCRGLQAWPQCRLSCIPLASVHVMQSDVIVESIIWDTCATVCGTSAC